MTSGLGNEDVTAWPDAAVNGSAEPGFGRDAAPGLLLERELRRTQQLARLGRLTGGVAYHFNDLLAVIANYAQFVTAAAHQRDGADWQQVRDDIGQIIQAAQRAAQLTRQLMIFAEPDLASPQVIQLNEVIEATSEQLAARLGSGITLRYSLDPRLVPVVADRGHIELALTCLTDNSAEAIGKGGAVTIRTCNADGTAGRPVRATGGSRHRVRDQHRCPGQDLRPVLHHQAGRPGRRARHGRGASDRDPVRWPGRGGVRTGGWNLGRDALSRRPRHGLRYLMPVR
jgi:signal transduction histidine kinase